MNKRLVVLLGVGQLILALLFALAVWNFADFYKNSLALESRISGNLFEAETHIFRFMKNLRRNVPGLRDAGTSLNHLSGKRKWGDPVISCAEDIENFSNWVIFSENGKMLAQTGRFVENERPISRNSFMLMVICGGISLIFLINGVFLLAVSRNMHAPNDRD